MADLRDLYKQAERNQEDFRRAEVSRAKDAEIATESLRRSVCGHGEQASAMRKLLLNKRAKIQKELEELRDKIGTMADNAQKKAEAAVAAAGASFREEAKYQHQTLAREGVNKQSAISSNRRRKGMKTPARNWGIGAAVACIVVVGIVAFIIWRRCGLLTVFRQISGNEWTPQLIYMHHAGVLANSGC